MAKRRKQVERVVTRKETHRLRRDAERSRRVMIGLAVVAGLLLILVGAGVITELVVKPRQPVAVVNGQAIASQDYQKRVRLDWFQASDQQITDPQGTSLQTLDQMIDEQIVRAEAKLRGITVSQEEVDQAIEKSFGYLRTPPTATPTPAVSPTPFPTPTPGGEPTATPFPTPTPVTLEAYQKEYQSYTDRLKPATGMSQADFRALVEGDLLRQKVYEAITKDVPATEEQVHARHILVSIREPQPTPTPDPTGQPTPTPDPSASPTPAPRDAAQALARVIEAQQKLGAGEDFAKVAAEYSDDTGSATDGGDLGWFGKGMMVPEFETAAFALEPGQISDPVQTSFGYHLIQVLEKDAARPSDAYTLSQRQYEFYNKWLTEQKAAAKIERFWSLDKVPPTPSALGG